MSIFTSLYHSITVSTKNNKAVTKISARENACISQKLHCNLYQFFSVEYKNKLVVNGRLQTEIRRQGTDFPEAVGHAGRFKAKQPAT